MEKIILTGRTPRDIGEQHGALFPGEIAALAEIRAELMLVRSDLTDRAQVTRLAAAHLPVMRDWDAALWDELVGLSHTSGASLEQLVVLNHYTDLRDIRRAAWAPAEDAPDPGGCSMALMPPEQPGAAVTGQTWDMHGSAEPFVRLIEVRLAGAPTATLLTLTGCLGMAGLNEEGVGVLINNLTPTDARVGVLWPAVVRRMLRETTAEAAANVLLGTPLGSGHHYLVSDGRDAFSIETSGREKRVYKRGVDGPILHTNHCLVPELLPLEELPEGTTTHLRLQHLSREVQALPARGASAAQLARAFGSHEGFPRSLCMHAASDDPHAATTCGAVVFDHARRQVLAVQGCCVDHPWSLTEVGGDRSVPVRFD